MEKKEKTEPQLDNFFRAGVNHLLWKKRLKSFLDGKETISKEEIVSHRDCNVGKWLYSEGIKKYGKVAEIQEFEKEHLGLHTIVRQVVALKESDNLVAAKQELEKIEPVSKKMITLLNTLEAKM